MNRRLSISIIILVLLVGGTLISVSYKEDLYLAIGDVMLQESQRYYKVQILDGRMTVGWGKREDTPLSRETADALSRHFVDYFPSFVEKELWFGAVYKETAMSSHELHPPPSLDSRRMKRTHSRVLLPFWVLYLLLLLLSSYPTAALIRSRQSRRLRLEWSLCLKCGYNLRCNTTGVCPECGTPIPESQKDLLG